MESTLPVWDFPCRKYVPAAAAISTITATPAARYVRQRRGSTATGTDEELAEDTALGAIEELDARPESKSRFNRSGGGDC